MEILYISAEYPPETGYGGIGTYTKHSAEGMAKRGHAVTVIARSDTTDETFLRYNNVEVHRIHPLPHPLPAHRYAYIFRRFCRHIFPHTLTRLCWSLAVARRLDYLVARKRRFDIIEAPECGAEGIFVKHRHCRRFIVRLHTPWEIIRKLDELSEPPGDMVFLPLLERFAGKHADAVSAPSGAIASILRQTWRLADVTVIANPLPPLPFVASIRNTWIYTGRIERRKGIHHLIAAYAAVKKERDVPVLKLIGKAYGKNRNGSFYGDFIRALIEANDLKNSIEWIEQATLNDVARHLEGAAVAFFPSLWENFPYACLEAMSCGCAVVTSNCGGFCEIVVDGESGILVEAGSVEAIAGSMRRLLAASGYAAALGECARKRATALTDADRICGEMELFYSKVRGT